MNSAMQNHPIIAKQIRILEGKWGVKGNKEGNDLFEV